MRAIFLFFLFLFPILSNAQVVGRSPVYKVRGNPNGIIGLDDQSGYYETILALDTLSNRWYDYSGSRVPRWQLVNTSTNTSFTPAVGISDTTVQKAIETVAGGRQVNFNWYVSLLGNDTLAKQGFPFSPGYTIKSMLDSAKYSTTYIYAGDYTWGIGGNQQAFPVHSPVGNYANLPAQSVLRNPSTKIITESGVRWIVTPEAPYSSGHQSIFNDSLGLYPRKIHITGRPTYKVGFAHGWYLLNAQSGLYAEIDTLERLNLIDGTNYPGAMAYVNSNINIDANVYIARPYQGLTQIGANDNISTVLNVRQIFGKPGIFSNTSKGILWLYGTATNNNPAQNWTATITAKEVNLDSFYYSNSLITGGGSAFIIGGGSPTNRRTERLRATFTIGSLSHRLPNGVGQADGRFSYAFDFSLDNKPLYNSMVTTTIDVVDINTRCLIIPNMRLEDTTYMSFTIREGKFTQSLMENISTIAAAHVFNKSSIFRIDCQDCRFQTKPAFEFSRTATAIDATSEFIISGNYTIATNQPFFQDVGESGYVFENVTAKCSGCTYLINSTNPVTYKVRGKITGSGYTTGLFSPNITVVYESQQTWKTANFTATASQSTYTVTGGRLPNNSAALRVVINGLEKIQGIDYTYVPLTGVITFTPALSGGEAVKISWYD